MQTSKRLDWIDGLRGIACLMVFWHHLMLSFFPASYYGMEKVSLLSGFDTSISYHPLGFLLNGNFWVNVFILIAAFLPACRILSCDDKDVKSVGGTIILRRFPRLAIPVTVVVFIKFITTVILNHFSLNYSGASLNYGFVK